MAHGVSASVNILRDFHLDSRQSLQLVLLRPDTRKLAWYGLSLSVGKSAFQDGVCYGAPGELGIQLQFDYTLARERSQPVVKLQFALLCGSVDLGRIDLYVKRSVSQAEHAELRLSLPRALKKCTGALIFRFDAERSEVSVVSPDAHGCLCQLADPHFAAEDVTVKVFEGKSKFLAQVPVYRFSDANLKDTRDDPDRFRFFGLPLESELLQTQRRPLTFISERFQFTVLFQLSSFCEAEGQVGENMVIPLYGSQCYLSTPAATDQKVLRWAAGTQVVQVRTER